VNVEVQEHNRHSLLWWTRQLIALRKRWKAFGAGALEFLSPDNRKVLAYVRRYEEECILVVANLSRFVQPVELDLASYQSRVPVELFGRAHFPPVADKPCFLTLGPHAFYWFSLEAKAPAQVESAGAPVGPQVRALLQVEAVWEEVLQEANRARLEAALQSWLPSRRWFGGKARTIKSVNILEQIMIPAEAEKAFLLFLQVEYFQTEAEMYAVPLACALGEKADPVCRDWPPLALAGETGDPNFRPEPWTAHAQRALFQSIRNLARQNFQLLHQRLRNLPPDIQDQARQIPGLEAQMAQRLRKIYERRIEAARIRIHGDYHLGQVLHTGRDFLIVDFEGEPDIAISQRRLKCSPLRDVAGMIRSFRYAANTALLKRTESGGFHPGQLQTASSWARYWSWWVSAAFLRAYLAGAGSAPFLPAAGADLEIMLESELLRKAISELGYELNNRPAWVGITFQGIMELMNPQDHL